MLLIISSMIGCGKAAAVETGSDGAASAEASVTSAAPAESSGGETESSAFTVAVNAIKTGEHIMNSDDRIISKLFFGLLPVQILLVAVSSINSIIDGAMAGNFIGPYALTVTGLYMPFIKLIETVNAVMLGGSQILCGRFLGRNRPDRTRGVFSLDMLLVISFSAVLTLVSLFAPAAIAGFLLEKPSLGAELEKYIIGMAAGILPQMLGVQLSAFLQLEHQEKRTYAGIGVMAGVNVLLDYLFVRVLSMGMLGLGLATSVSYVVFLAVLGSYYFTKKAVIRFEFRSIRWKDIGPVLKIGLPGALATFCLAVRGIGINGILLDCSGNDGVAALAALNTFGYLLYAFTAGLASATRLLASVYGGEEDRVSLVLIMKTALFKGVLIVCAISAVVIALSGPITFIFFKDPASNVFVLTKQLFMIFPFSMPLSAISAVFSNYYQTMSRMKIVNLLSVIDGVLGVLLFSLLLAPVMGATGVWIAHVLNGVCTTAAVVLYAWAVNRRFPRSVESLITLPEGFGVPADHRLDISVSNTEEVVNTSIRVMEFCTRMGVDKKRSYFAGLCLEEMAENVVKHGFKGAKKKSADIRVVYKEDELILRIKDDTHGFDPVEKLTRIDRDDLSRYIGLRMVEKIAKDMYYSHLLGLNVLTIRL